MRGDFRITSFTIHKDLFQRFEKRLPKHGDRTKALQRLVEMFLNGELPPLKIPGRSL